MKRNLDGAIITGDYIEATSIALVGYGNIGRAFVDLLYEVDPEGKQFVFSGVASRSIGILKLKNSPAKSAAKEVEDMLGDPSSEHGTDSDNIGSWLKESEYDVLVEAIPSNYSDAEPALTYILTGLENGNDVITCNKAPIAMFYDVLQKSASKSGARLRFESTVLDGTPLFSMFRRALPDVKVKKMRGILNSTCNIVIDSLNEGRTLEQGIEQAVRGGIAETDPSTDLKGFDSAAKLVILANVLGGERLGIPDIATEALTPEAFYAAKKVIGGASSAVVRQVSTADFESKTFRVGLEPVESGDVLFGCRGASNAIAFNLDLFGELIVAERNPSLRDTAFGIYSDLVELRSEKKS